MTIVFPFLDPSVGQCWVFHSYWIYFTEIYFQLYQVSQEKNSSFFPFQFSDVITEKQASMSQNGRKDLRVCFLNRCLSSSAFRFIFNPFVRGTKYQLFHSPWGVYGIIFSESCNSITVLGQSCKSNNITSHSFLWAPTKLLFS